MNASRRRVVVFTGGPSLPSASQVFCAEFDIEEFHCACVKSARPDCLLGRRAEWLFLNDWNLNSRSLKDAERFENVVFSYSDDWTSELVYSDHSAKVNPHLRAEDFFSQTHPNRIRELPIGPGIVLECVIPYLIWAGYREIILVGWDVGFKGKNANVHLRESKIGYYFKMFVDRIYRLALKRSYRRVADRILYLSGITIRRAGMAPNEYEYVMKRRVWLQSILAERFDVNIQFIDSNTKDL